jgi:hypothetical protein
MLRVAGLVRPLPGVSQIHVVADGDQYPPLLIVNPAPTRSEAIKFVRYPSLQRGHAWNLDPFVKIVEHMKDSILIIDLHHRAIWEHFGEARHEDLPFDGPMEIVHHQEPTAVQWPTSTA